MIQRLQLLHRIRHALKRSRVVALIGPRQCGKTTLARQIVRSDSIRYFDLERTADLGRLAEPESALTGFRGTIVIDEVQRRPDIFPILRVLADRTPLPARFLILGSTSPELLRQSSESLAGRMEVIPVGGFGLTDVGLSNMNRHWQRGGFPLSYLARSNTDSATWRQQFIQTLLERDLPQLGVSIPASALLRFWKMVAHYHGNLWNNAEPARSLGVSEPAIRRYLDLFTNLLVVRQLQPWHANLGKRQVKSPKVYMRDSGLLHALLGVHNEKELLSHPKSGASWEGYAVEELLKTVEPDESYFWATHQGAELDLLAIKRGRRVGIEIKRMDAPKITPSIRTALSDLDLEHLTIVYPGSLSYELGERVSVRPLATAIASGFEGLLAKRKGHRSRSNS